MIITIAQYLEAIVNSDGRFKTLERLFPLVDDSGAPRFSMPGHGLADFEVSVDGKPFVLRCPLRHDEVSVARLRALGEKDRGLGSRFFTEWMVLEGEMVLFDAAGEAFEVDVLVRPSPVGESFERFVEHAVARGDSATVNAVRKSFEELVLWAAEVGRSGIALRRLVVAHDGVVSLTGFSATDETARIREMLRAATESVGAAITAESTSGESPQEKSRAEYDFGGEEPKCVRDGGGWVYVDGQGRPLVDDVWLAASLFRRGRAEVETHEGKGLIDISGRRVLETVYEEVTWDEYWGVAAVMTEGRWSLVDRDGRLLTRETYDWIGECSEGLLLAEKGGKSGFLDVVGREVIQFVYDEAHSFFEGIAPVSRGGESFYIDAAGRRI